MSFEQVFLIGISGGSASGKTSFLRDLKSQFANHEMSIISQDNYYKPIELQARDSNNQINFDLPGSIHLEEFATDVEKLKAGRSIERLEYTFNNAKKLPEHITVHPAPILVVEGLFIFYHQAIANQLDLRIYIDAHEAIKLSRRLKRDAEERGYPADAVHYQWQNHVMPSYYTYLRPYREQADLIITNNQSYAKGLEVLCGYLRNKLQTAG